MVIPSFHLFSTPFLTFRPITLPSNCIQNLANPPALHHHSPVSIHRHLWPRVFQHTLNWSFYSFPFLSLAMICSLHSELGGFEMEVKSYNWGSVLWRASSDRTDWSSNLCAGHKTVHSAPLLYSTTSTSACFSPLLFFSLAFSPYFALAAGLCLFFLLWTLWIYHYLSSCFLKWSSPDIHMDYSLIF